MKPQLLALKQFVQTEFEKVDFETFRQNFNRCLEREQSTLLIYEDDDYDDQSFFLKPMLSDAFFISSEVVKQLDLLAVLVDNPKGDVKSCCQSFYEALTLFISALAITKGVDVGRYHQQLGKRFGVLTDKVRIIV